MPLRERSERTISYQVIRLRRRTSHKELREVTSIYFGGGTPTFLSPSLLERILRACHEGFTLSPEVEISIEALLIARKVGFENVNVDLIFGIPTESLSDWMRTLQRVIDLEPTHISTYSLEIHHGTEMERRILRGELEEVGEDEQADMYLLARDLLTSHGFEHYEISNFARDGYRCRHNLLYKGFSPEGFGEFW